MPLGLVLNELISNSLKYAYPYETGGKYCGPFKGTKVTLKVEDNGASSLMILIFHPAGAWDSDW